MREGEFIASQKNDPLQTRFYFIALSTKSVENCLKTVLYYLHLEQQILQI